MNCPVCEKEMTGPLCDCGYDRSRDFEMYPTFAPVPEGMESVAVLRDRLNNLVRCEGCGGHTFVLNKKTGSLACSGCGRALSAEELKPLTDALGMKKSEAKKPVSRKKVLEAMLDPENVAKHGKALEEFTKEDWEEVQALAEAQNPMVDPNRIVAVSAGYEHTVVLYADGTVAAVGSNTYKECVLENWRDIVAISAGYHRTLGLKKDGTVVRAGHCYGNQKDVENWKNIAAIATGTFHTVGLRKDGTVVAVGDKGGGRTDVTGWNDIIAIAAGDRHTLALDKFGKVFLAGKGKMLPRGGWNQMRAIAAGDSDHSVALTEDGTVVIAGEGGKPAELGGNIVEVDAGFSFTVVRKADGTASISGYCTNGRNDVKNWTDLELITAGRLHVVGLRKDGTLVAAGVNKKGQCDVHKLMRK